MFTGAKRMPIFHSCRALFASREFGGALAASLMALWLPLGAALAQTQTSNRAMTPSQTLTAANERFAQGDFAEARKLYQKVLLADPQNLTALRNLGECYFAEGKRGFDAAARYYSRAFEIDPRSKETAQKLVECLEGLGRSGAAAAVLQKIAEWPGAPPTDWKRAAEDYEAAGDAPNAEAAFEAYLERAPGDLGARTDLGVLYGRQKDFADALEQFRLALSANPNFPPALIGMARVFSWQGRYEESVKLYDRVLRLDPSNGDAAAGKAFVFLWTGKTSDAASLFARLHSKFPRDSEITRGLEAARAAEAGELAAAARRARQPAEAENYYRQILAGNPSDVESLKALAALTTTPARCTESIEFGRKAMESAPADASLSLMLANSLEICRQDGEAIARYRQYLEARPASEEALYRLGHLLRIAGRRNEAIEVDRKLLALDPENHDAQLELAQCLAAIDDYAAALLLYDKVIAASPENYDALQGKAFVLLWTNRLSEARRIFESLAQRQPGDSQNAEALETIIRRNEEAVWAALRPPPGSPPRAFADYYRRRLASYPDDDFALRGLAAAQSQLGDLASAIESYKTLTGRFPGDLDAQMELARLEGIAGQYDSAAVLYLSILRARPGDPEILKNLARIYSLAGRPRQALEIYEGLSSGNPSNTDYSLEVARLASELQDDAAAREALATTLSLDPSNLEARKELAQLDFQEERREDSIREFDRALDQSPGDPAALMGEARAAYFQGDLARARVAAATLVAQNPRNFDALMLLAEIQNARGRWRDAQTLLAQAEKLHPDGPELSNLKSRVREESAVTVHTTASFAHETGPPIGFILEPVGRTYSGEPNEDLRMFSFSTTVRASLLPRVDSYFTLAGMPTNVPPSPWRDAQGNRISTVNSGGAEPAFFMTRQDWRISRLLTLRGGAGIARLGPVEIDRLPQLGPSLAALNNFYGQAVLTALKIYPELASTVSLAPMLFGGATFTAQKRLRLNFGVTRSPAIEFPFPYVMQRGLKETRIDAGLDLGPWQRTEVHFNYFLAHYATEPLTQVEIINEKVAVQTNSVPCFMGTQISLSPYTQTCLSGHTVVSVGVDADRGQGATMDLNRNFLRSDWLSLDAGYSGLIEGFAGYRQGVFLGFFNPGYYREDLVTARVRGKLGGPLGYDFSAGVGDQVIEHGNPLTLAAVLSPGLTLKLSPNHALTLRYTHYNTAQTLGALRGNSVQISTDWRM